MTWGFSFVYSSGIGEEDRQGLWSPFWHCLTVSWNYAREIHMRKSVEHPICCERGVEVPVVLHFVQDDGCASYNKVTTLLVVTRVAVHVVLHSSVFFNVVFKQRCSTICYALTSTFIEVWRWQCNWWRTPLLPNHCRQEGWCLKSNNVRFFIGEEFWKQKEQERENWRKRFDKSKKEDHHGERKKYLNHKWDVAEQERKQKINATFRVRVWRPYLKNINGKKKLIPCPVTLHHMRIQQMLLQLWAVADQKNSWSSIGLNTLVW